MSYPMDLDEYSEQTLKDELALRKSRRAQGLCDYCDRPVSVTPSCKFPSRHNKAPKKKG